MEKEREDQEHEQNNDLAFELVKELAMSSRRQEKGNKRIYIVAVILAVALFLSNMAWLYVFQSYDYTSTITVDSGSNGGDAIYQNGEGNQAYGEGCKDNKQNEKRQ